MEKKCVSIYDALKQINKLDANMYSKLSSIYGYEVVNKTIEELMEENARDAFKFEYYINQIIKYDDMAMPDNNFDCYGMDLDLIPLISKEDNERVSNELFMVITMLNQLVNDISFDKVDLSKVSWLSDRVNKCIEICDDEDKLKELKHLYSQFVDKRNFLVNGNLRLVISVAKKYNMSDTLFNEAIQYGNMGLMRAVEKFDPVHKASFSTYAYYWIKQAITRNLHCTMHSYNIPVHQVTSYYRLKRVKRELYAKLKREPSTDELASELDMTRENVVLLLNAFNEAYSLYETVNGEDETDGIYMDFIEDENASVENAVFDTLLSEEIKEALSLLSDRERFVLQERFGLVDGREKTLEEVGKLLGVTRERIRQIEAKTVRKLSRRCKNLENYL